jgi:hypothetical protein
MRIGSFKTAHPGDIQLDDRSDLPPFTKRTVCVKQVYERLPNNAISRIRGRHELDAFSVECNCLRWASILLDITYQFVAREIDIRGEPPLPIPALRFTKIMIAVVQASSEKAFLVEEWINTDDGDQPFVKYINNQFPQSCIPYSASSNAREIAEFLCFAQHVQWEKSKYSVFTSDYQGAGNLLTDPQITSNPYVFGILPC